MKTIYKKLNKLCIFSVALSLIMSIFIFNLQNVNAADKTYTIKYVISYYKKWHDLKQPIDEWKDEQVYTIKPGEQIDIKPKIRENYYVFMSSMFAPNSPSQLSVNKQKPDGNVTGIMTQDKAGNYTVKLSVAPIDGRIEYVYMFEKPDGSRELKSMKHHLAYNTLTPLDGSIEAPAFEGFNISSTYKFKLYQADNYVRPEYTWVDKKLEEVGLSMDDEGKLHGNPKDYFYNYQFSLAYLYYYYDLPTYTVNTNITDGAGTVDVSVDEKGQLDNGKIRKGNDVTVNWQLNEGYKIDSITVNNKEVAPTDNEIIFEALDNNQDVMINASLINENVTPIPPEEPTVPDDPIIPEEPTPSVPPTIVTPPEVPAVPTPPIASPELVAPINNPQVVEEVIETPVTPESPVETPVQEDIESNQIPLASKNENNGAWALVNLLCVGVTVLLGFWLLISKRYKEENEEEEIINTSKRGMFTRLLAIALGIISIIVFILTENIVLPMVFVDKWTIVMLAIMVVQITIFCIGRKWKQEKNYSQVEFN